MADKIVSLITQEGRWLPVEGRTAGILAEAYRWRDDLEASRKGQLVLDFKDGRVTSSLRKHSEGRRID